MLRRNFRWFSPYFYTSVAVLLVTSQASANTIIGIPDAPDNVFPFGTNAYVGEYQQLYSNLAFPAPVSITGLGFASSPVGGNAGLSRTLNLTLSLSPTSATLPS